MCVTLNPEELSRGSAAEIETLSNPDNRMQKENSMSVKQIHDEGQRLRYPTGKILGIIDKPADVDRLARALESAGFRNIELRVATSPRDRIVGGGAVRVG